MTTNPNRGRMSEHSLIPPAERGYDRDALVAKAKET
jgi:hypothetical protein